MSTRLLQGLKFFKQFYMPFTQETILTSWIKIGLVVLLTRGFFKLNIRTHTLRYESRVQRHKELLISLCRDSNQGLYNYKGNSIHVPLH
jgi:hypothetical protein